MHYPRRRREVPTVGPIRGDNQCFHTRAQTKPENNEHHRALEGHSRHEEVADRFGNYEEKEARKKSRTGIPSRTSSIYDCVVVGRYEK
jgi:hypothetical protein